MKVQHILETCLYVDDLPRADRFYSQVLGLIGESRHEGRHIFFHCGQQMLLLFNPLSSRDATNEVPAHGALGVGHVAFAVREAELPSWVQWLEQHGVAIEKDTQWPGGGRSLYFRDPAGNSVELATPRIWGLEEPE